MGKRLNLTFRVSISKGTKTLVLSGKVARTLRALIISGKTGVTAKDSLCFTMRLSEYIRSLRHDYFLNIETINEKHNGIDGSGTHGRYILHSDVSLLSDREVA